MSSIQLKDVSDVFPDGNVWGVYTSTYSEKDLAFKFRGGTLQPIKHKEELLELIETTLLDSKVDKITVKAEGKFLRDLHKSAIVYTWSKRDFRVLPKIGQLIKYKDECLDSFEKYEVRAIDFEDENIIVKYTFYHFGKNVSYVGISFSEYFIDMEVIND